MPVPLKLALSVIVAIVAAVMFYLEMDRGAVDVAWVSAGLGAFMIFALWLFPETRRR